MRQWDLFILTARAPVSKVCKNCPKSKEGCKERKTCTEYAVERLVRGIALAENRKARDAEYDLRRNAQRSGRLKQNQY